LRDNGASLLIAAVSGRQLAQAARRAGFTPLVADFFADTDTQEAAHACRKLRASIRRGLQRETLIPALEALAASAPSPILGFVYGAGFEDRPERLRLVAKRWPVLGNAAETVSRIKAPEIFFAEIDRLGIKHPATVRERPASDEGWLAKRIGGAGGSHIVPARRGKSSSDRYFQRRAEGRAVSVLFVGNGVDARVLGSSEQWAAPTARSPFRYGGAARPALLSSASAKQMSSAVRRISEVFGLKGLGSADFLVNDTEALLLEINPRPGATLDIFDCGATPLMHVHLNAVLEGKLPGSALKFRDAMASAIVYAETGVMAPAAMVWPPWSADRPKPAEWIDKNRPICTVWARGKTPAQALRLVEERSCKIWNAIQRVSRGEDGE
jgi:uncharacterized protein